MNKFSKSIFLLLISSALIFNFATIGAEPPEKPPGEGSSMGVGEQSSSNITHKGTSIINHLRYLY